ncbi:uncharacterized protein LOC143296372 isoform X2 [Babylonia areolata]
MASVCRLKFAVRHCILLLVTGSLLILLWHHMQSAPPDVATPQQPTDDVEDFIKEVRNKVDESPDSPVKANQEPALLDVLGVFVSRNEGGWFRRDCNSSRQLREVSVSTPVGDLRMYVYDSPSDDKDYTKMLLKGWYVEKKEMAQFLRLSRDLPLIDVGGNLGLVTLQAATMGRQVVVVEPVPETALRLCRSVMDFGHSALVHVVQNAVSSRRGPVSLAASEPKAVGRYEVLRFQEWGFEPVQVDAILLDDLVDVLPFRRAALKIDVESHEGHVLAGAERLFQEIDIPLVWMEWEHVKYRPEYGGADILQFMQKHHMEPFDLMTGERLRTELFLFWPPTVLWRKTQ